MRDDHGNDHISRTAPFEMLDCRGSDGTARLELAGELDLASCQQLAARLEALATHRTPVRLDISGLTFIDSSGLAVLVRHARDSRRDGWTLHIARDGLQRQVQRVIELVGADEILWPPEARATDPAAGD